MNDAHIDFFLSNVCNISMGVTTNLNEARVLSVFGFNGDCKMNFVPTQSFEDG